MARAFWWEGHQGIAELHHTCTKLPRRPLAGQKTVASVSLNDSLSGPVYTVEVSLRQGSVCRPANEGMEYSNPADQGSLEGSHLTADKGAALHSSRLQEESLVFFT